MATVIKADRVAALPGTVTLFALELVPDGEPPYVRIRRSARWSEHAIDPERLAQARTSPVRYRLGAHSIVMPDARSR